MTGLGFGDALGAVRQGKRARRVGWKPGLWIAAFGIADKYDGLDVEPCLCHKVSRSKLTLGWVPSQADMLAVDWEVVK
jgi:hypothetical protein